jgi:hypothetical protein
VIDWYTLYLSHPLAGYVLDESEHQSAKANHQLKPPPCTTNLHPRLSPRRTKAPTGPRPGPAREKEPHKLPSSTPPLNPINSLRTLARRPLQIFRGINNRRTDRQLPSRIMPWVTRLDHLRQGSRLVVQQQVRNEESAAVSINVGLVEGGEGGVRAEDVGLQTPKINKIHSRWTCPATGLGLGFTTIPRQSRI